MNSSFEALGLSEALVRAVSELGYTQPTPIQQQAIPAVLAGGDLLAGAQTGTGKTAGFVLPILQRLSTQPAHSAHGKPRRPVRVLILTPTRELAAQVEESVRDYGKHTRASVAVVYGGVSINNQIAALKRGVDIVVATPGRLLDHAGQRTIDLSQVEVLVLDEADRMLDMGFLPDMKRVFALLRLYREGLTMTGCAMGCPIGNLALELSDNHPRVRDLIHANFENWLDVVSGWLEAAGSRLPKDVDRRELARFVLTVMEGGIMQSRASGDLAPFDASVAQLRAYFDLLIARAKGNKK